jgi:pseudaminic acid cytidylyltransferase
MNIAILPARDGSKRIPKKNVKYFRGKPMLAWPLQAALKSKLFDKIIVSTDSEEIGDIAVKFGASVPFLRPAELADDLTPTAPVLLHTLEFLKDEGIIPEYACCIYPTAPFLQPEYLIEGFNKIAKTGAPGVLSVTTFSFPILRSFKILADGSVKFTWPKYEMTRSQDLPEYYHDAGQFYWLNVATFLTQRRLIMPGTMPIVLPRKFVQDLDTQEDWEIAELMADSLISSI